ncbi:transcriptional adapter 3-like [Sitodiplosis mosellana]|uniref:transcriptional adapter 3-like n=1 Tax=Sitodiplosis mosellana TaxID=263140 RepID=UPI002443B683|nr:transcriptional adapter 3-like [Sitodiplosis mosellana]
MTGKKIQNATGKGRTSYQNAGNHQIVSTNKNPIKQMTTATATATTNSSGPMANSSKFNSIPPVPVTSTVIPIAQPNMSTLIKTCENFKYLPRYTTALTKPAVELFPAEELDGIQLELEILLSTVALRYRSLKSGFDSLDREDKNHKKNEKLSGKRKRDDANKKSAKEAKTANQPAKIAKVKASGSSDSPAHSQHTDDSMDGTIPPPHTNSQSSSIGQSNPKVLVPKNDIPNKFWLSVEPYCMPITQEDVKLLDDMIEEYSTPLVPPIPELGPHYASRWATEDLREEQDNSNANAKANKRFTNAANPEVNSMLKKGEKVANEKMMAEGITGPLTQRLVAALLEENLLNSKGVADILGSSDGLGSMANESNDSCGENNSSSANRSAATPIASLLRNGIDVEIRLKKELIELGILDISDFPKEKDDEVLNEIKRVRTELESIAEYNLNELKELRLAAKEEMKRLEIKRKLDAVDQELIESYKRVWAAKQKRHPLTKQQKNEIYRLIEEQKRLGDQLEAMPFPGFNKTICQPKSTE